MIGSESGQFEIAGFLRSLEKCLPGGAVRIPEFRSWGLGFESRWRLDSFQT